MLIIFRSQNLQAKVLILVQRKMTAVYSSLFRVELKGIGSKHIKDMDKGGSHDDKKKKGNEHFADGKFILAFGSLSNGHVASLGHVLVKLGGAVSNVSRKCLSAVKSEGQWRIGAEVTTGIKRLHSALRRADYRQSEPFDIS